jgi:hypothetical protein
VRTELQLILRIWGARLDPGEMTLRTGVSPRRAFEVGEARGRAASQVAGWEWESRTGNDVEPLMADLVRALGPHASHVKAAADAGAMVQLTVVGTVAGDLIPDAVTADATGYAVPEGEGFEPFIAADRPVIYFDEAALGFLSATSAVLEVHLDFDLDARRTG